MACNSSSFIYRYDFREIIVKYECTNFGSTVSIILSNDDTDDRGGGGGGGGGDGDVAAAAAAADFDDVDSDDDAVADDGNDRPKVPLGFQAKHSLVAL